MEDVSIDTLGAPMRDLVDGMHNGNVKVLREKDGTPRAVVIDAEMFEKLAHQEAYTSPFTVDDVIAGLESIRDHGTVSEEEVRRSSEARMERLRKRSAEALAKG
jgi:PHD/YefM family antitoxin component YafN of YafNO toxin-antitoxin module